MTGGHTANPPPGSELPVAQALREISAVERAIGGSFEHTALNGIGPLHGFEAFGEPAGAFAGAVKVGEEEAA